MRMTWSRLAGLTLAAMAAGGCSDGPTVSQDPVAPPAPTAVGHISGSLAASAALPELAPLSPSLEGTLKSGPGDQTSITFVNLTTEVRQIFWLDSEGSRVLYCTLAAGESCFIITYLTHPWLVTDEAGTGLAIYLPEPFAAQVTLGGDSCPAGSSLASASDCPGGLTLVSDPLDLGEVVVGSSLLPAFAIGTVTNEASQPISITGIDDCPDQGFKAVSENFPVVLNPGDSHQFDFEFIPRAEGPVTCKFEVRNTGTPDRLVSAEFAGTGIGPAKGLEKLADMITSGLPAGTASGLLASLNAAEGLVADGRTGAAVNAMRAFENKVDAFLRSGRLDPQLARVLLESAGDIINGLR